MEACTHSEVAIIVISGKCMMFINVQLSLSSYLHSPRVASSYKEAHFIHCLQRILFSCLCVLTTLHGKLTEIDHCLQGILSSGLVCVDRGMYTHCRINYSYVAT